MLKPLHDPEVYASIRNRMESLRVDTQRQWGKMSYHGVLGPRAAWRSEIVRRATSAGDGETAMAEVPGAQAGQTDTSWAAQCHARGQCWAELSVTQQLQHLHDELVRRHYAGSTSQSYQVFLLEDRKLAVGTVVTYISAVAGGRVREPAIG